MSTFSEIADGFGLDEVPASYRKELQCCYCLGSDTGRGKLYSDRGRGFRWGTLTEISSSAGRRSPALLLQEPRDDALRRLTQGASQPQPRARTLILALFVSRPPPVLFPEGKIAPSALSTMLIQPHLAQPCKRVIPAAKASSCSTVASCFILLARSEMTWILPGTYPLVESMRSMLGPS